MRPQIELCAKRLKDAGHDSQSRSFVREMNRADELSRVAQFLRKTQWAKYRALLGNEPVESSLDEPAPTAPTAPST
jgi:hypothetical protein